MKFKEVQKCGVFTWSPSAADPCIAIASSKHFDSNFGSDSSIDIFNLNIKDSLPNLSLRSSIETGQSFTALAWHPDNHLITSNQQTLQIYSFQDTNLKYNFESKANDVNHPQSLNCLDLNAADPSLVATGSNNGTITIWDLNNNNIKPISTLSPTTMQNDEVLTVQWNKPVKSILASASNSNIYVWDTRKKDQASQIMRVFDSNAVNIWGPQSSVVCRSLAWSSTHSTTLIVANSNDQNPIIQMWDLRYTASPIKYLQGGHTRGINAIAWNSFDEHILISAAKDNTFCIWNPAAEQNEDPLYGVLPYITNQWAQEVKWCPFNPPLFAIGSLDGHTTVYNLTKTNLLLQENSKIMESFSLDSPFISQPLQTQINSQLQPQNNKVILSKAPNWMKTPCGANWGFGGKLFCYKEIQQSESERISKHVIEVYSVVNDTAFVSRAEKLEDAIKNENLLDFCKFKMNEFYTLNNEPLALAWRFLSTHFYETDEERKVEVITLLGYGPENKDSLSEISNSLSQLNTSNCSESAITHSPINEQYDSDSAGTSSLEASPQKYKNEILSPSLLQICNPLKIDTQVTQTNSAIGSMINKSILTGDVEKAIESCVTQNFWTEALLLCWFACPDSLPSTLKSYFTYCSSSKDSSWSSLLWCIVFGRLSVEGSDKSENANIILKQLVNSVDLIYWKETLAFVIREGDNDEFQFQLFDILAERLLLQQKTDNNPAWIIPAMYCYILNGNYGGISSNCQAVCGNFLNSIEFLLVLQKISRYELHSQAANELISRFAQSLACEGKLEIALKYLQQTSADEELKQRIAYHLQYKNKPVTRTRQFSQTNQFQAQRSRSSSISQNVSSVAPFFPPPSNMPSNQMYQPNVPLYTPPPTPMINKPPIAAVEPMSAFNQNIKYGPPPGHYNPNLREPLPRPACPPAPPMMNPNFYAGYQQPSNEFNSYSAGWNDPPTIDPQTSKLMTPTVPLVPISTPVPNYTGLIEQEPPQQGSFHQSRRSSQGVKTKTPPPPVVELSQKDKQLFSPFENLLRLLQEQFQLLTVPMNVRRKIEDVRPKLDLLKVKLANNQLSSTTMDGLNQLASAINKNDFPAGFALHANLVASTPFSETAGFLPAIKVLLHLAQQYVRI